MKIVVAARCYNEIRNVERFLKGYSFADEIVISDGGSDDGSVEALQDKVTLLHFDGLKESGGVKFNDDAPHMNFVLDYAKSLNPDWLIFDDFDCNPNESLRQNARKFLEYVMQDIVYQVNVFRLYLWGDDHYFPSMNNYFDSNYTSVWAWRPDKLNIYADPSNNHGTLLGLSADNFKILAPYCLLHKSWNPETVDDKIKKYSVRGIAMNHPLQFAGQPEPLPDWATE